MANLATKIRSTSLELTINGSASARTIQCDRGIYRENNVSRCEQKGMKSNPSHNAGSQNSATRSRLEEPGLQGQRFRAGIEGRISVLFRGRGMKRCLAEGREHFDLRVGAAVLANNLLRIAGLLKQPSSRKQKAA